MRAGGSDDRDGADGSAGGAKKDAKKTCVLVIVGPPTSRMLGLITLLKALPWEEAHALRTNPSPEHKPAKV